MDYAQSDSCSAALTGGSAHRGDTHYALAQRRRAASRSSGAYGASGADHDLAQRRRSAHRDRCARLLAFRHGCLAGEVGVGHQNPPRCAETPLPGPGAGPCHPRASKPAFGPPPFTPLLRIAIPVDSTGGRSGRMSSRERNTAVVPPPRCAHTRLPRSGRRPTSSVALRAAIYAPGVGLSVRLGHGIDLLERVPLPRIDRLRRPQPRATCLGRASSRSGRRGLEECGAALISSRNHSPRERQHGGPPTMRTSLITAAAVVLGLALAPWGAGAQRAGDRREACLGVGDGDPIPSDSID